MLENDSLGKFQASGKFQLRKIFIKKIFKIKKFAIFPGFYFCFYFRISLEKIPKSKKKSRYFQDKFFLENKKKM